MTTLEVDPLAKELGDRFQFEREGYFCADSVESRPGRLVFNRTIGLRDSFGK